MLFSERGTGLAALHVVVHDQKLEGRSSEDPVAIRHAQVVQQIQAASDGHQCEGVTLLIFRRAV